MCISKESIALHCLTLLIQEIRDLKKISCTSTVKNRQHIHDDSLTYLHVFNSNLIFSLHELPMRPSCLVVEPEPEPGGKGEGNLGLEFQMTDTRQNCR